MAETIWSIVALLGGTAIYLASVAAAAVMLPQVFPQGRTGQMQLFGLWAASTLVFWVSRS